MCKSCPIPLTGPSEFSDSAGFNSESSKVKIVSASSSDLTTLHLLMIPSDEIEINETSNGPSVSSYCHFTAQTGSVCLIFVEQRYKGSFDLLKAVDYN